MEKTIKILSAISMIVSAVMLVVIASFTSYFCHRPVKESSFDASTSISVTSVVLSESNLSLEVGDTYKLYASVYPTNATNKALTWKTTNTLVATVGYNGIVYAQGVGVAYVYATTSNNCVGRCKVTVKSSQPNELQLNQTNLSLYIGETYTLSASMLDGDIGIYYDWSSENTAIAQVTSYGKVTAMSVGSTRIKVSSSNGLTKYCSVTVKSKDVPCTSLILNKSTLNLEVGDTFDFVLTKIPSNTTSYVLWKSSNSSVVSVNGQGHIVAVAKGSATITVYTSDNSCSYTCEVTVVDAVIPCEEITLNLSAVTLKTNAWFSLRVGVSPSNTTSIYSFRSLDTSIATVDTYGNVHAISSGQTVIIVETDNGQMAGCIVNVN